MAGDLMLLVRESDRGRAHGDVAHRARDQRLGDLAGRYIYVELDFDTVEQAEGFKRFLETRVWSNPDASPALQGAPTARVLTEVEVG